MESLLRIGALAVALSLAACSGGAPGTSTGASPSSTETPAAAGDTTTPPPPSPTDTSSTGTQPGDAAGQPDGTPAPTDTPAQPDTAREGACPDVAYAAPNSAGASFYSGSVWVTDATTKIRPNDALGSTQLSQIEAARNEYEMFQVVIRNGGGTLRVTDVHFALPTLPRGNLSDVERVMVYRTGYMNVTTPSNSEGATGLWPDALIPKIDTYACEQRNAFPVDVPVNRNQAFFVDVHVPRHTQPGTYPGTLTITAVENPGTASARTLVHSQGVDLKVWNFTLPSTASLQSSFGFVGGSLGQGHGKTFSRNDLRKLSNQYALAGLRNRIAITSGLAQSPPYTYRNGVVTIDWTEIDEDIGPFLDGTVHHNGAKWSAVDIRPFNPPIYRTDGATGLAAYYRAYAAHFKQKGWFDKLWGYTRDEPSAAEFPEVKERARAMLEGDPGMRPLVTKGLADGLRDTAQTSPIRIWTPLVNQMSESTRAQFDPYIAAGAELWWYQSCESHGCFGNDVTGYPSYMIDIPGAYNRVMPWLSFAYRTTGELYFNTMEAYYKVADPWTSVYLFTGNGDGTLFYPGRPDKIGGSAHVPVESLRLKLIREGHEDYEYLRLLAGADAGYVAEQVRLVARTPRDFARGAAPYYSARRAVGERLSALVANGAINDKADGY